MPHFPFITVLCLTCGAPAEAGFHFCAEHLALPWERAQIPVRREPAQDQPVHVHIIECHPSSNPLMAAAGYRLLKTEFDPATYQPVVCYWVLDRDE